MCSNQRSDVYTLKGVPLQLMDKFHYLGSSAASIENDINMQLAKAWTAINRLSVTEKSDLTNEMQFFPSCSHVNTAIWIHYFDANITYGEKAWWQLPTNAVSCIEQVLEATPYKTVALSPPITNHENNKSLTNQTCRTLLEKWGQTHKWYTPVDLFIWMSEGKTTS